MDQSLFIFLIMFIVVCLIVLPRLRRTSQRRQSSPGSTASRYDAAPFADTDVSSSINQQSQSGSHHPSHHQHQPQHHHSPTIHSTPTHQPTYTPPPSHGHH